MYKALYLIKNILLMRDADMLEYFKFKYKAFMWLLYSGISLFLLWIPVYYLDLIGSSSLIMLYSIGFLFLICSLFLVFIFNSMMLASILYNLKKYMNSRQFKIASVKFLTISVLASLLSLLITGVVNKEANSIDVIIELQTSRIIKEVRLKSNGKVIKSLESPIFNNNVIRFNINPQNEKNFSIELDFIEGDKLEKVISPYYNNSLLKESVEVIIYDKELRTKLIKK